jgi:uncharacterized phiE125 gp8 family phage protein
VTTLQLITPPTEAPITVSEAKSHIRLALGITADDTDVGAYIDAATGLLESYAGRSFVARTMDMVFDRIPDGGVIELRRPPFVSVTGVFTTSDADVESEVASTVYRVSLGTGRVVLRRGQAWPYGSTLAELDAWRVRYVAGYGDADDVPEPVKQAIRLQVAEWYENRGDDPAGVQLALGEAAKGVIRTAGLKRYVL